MDPSAALTEMGRTREAIDRVEPPPVPGVYGWFVRSDGRVGPFGVSANEPIYVGRSIDLAERSLRNHFKSGETGWSTLRRSLGAILKGDLGLIAVPRGASASKSNIGHYRFSEAGEDALTNWMKSNLDFGFCSAGDPETLERAILAVTNPLLNLKDCDNPHARDIKRLRKVCAEEAARGA